MRDPLWPLMSRQQFPTLPKKILSKNCKCMPCRDHKTIPLWMARILRSLTTLISCPRHMASYQRFCSHFKCPPSIFVSSHQTFSRLRPGAETRARYQESKLIERALEFFQPWKLRKSDIVPLAYQDTMLGFVFFWDYSILNNGWTPCPAATPASGYCLWCWRHKTSVRDLTWCNSIVNFAVTKATKASCCRHGHVTV